MNEIKRESCLLCGSSARYYKIDHGNLKYFSCDNCTFYQISELATNMILDTPNNQKEMLSTLARDAPERHVLILTMENTDGGTQELTPTYILK